jgi:3-oxoacyl-[acyl-carrier protein] reductase
MSVRRVLKTGLAALTIVADMPWETPLRGKRALIVGGAGGGIGSAVSQAIADAGAAALVVADIDLARAQAEVGSIISRGGIAHGRAVDVRDPQSIEAVVRTAVQLMSGIDVLVCIVGGHNAFASWQSITETSHTEWRASMLINVDYVFDAVRTVLPTMVAQGGGSIVTIGSLNGIRSSPMAVAYGAAKAALANMACTVALEYATAGIRMNVVSLGLVATPMSDRPSIAGTPRGRVAAMEGSIPRMRAGLPSDAANAVVFLASPLADYISGHNLVVDGATSARYPLPVEGAGLNVAG